MRIPVDKPHAFLWIMAYYSRMDKDERDALLGSSITELTEEIEKLRRAIWAIIKKMPVQSEERVIE